MKLKDTFFVKSGTRPSHYPDWDMFEVAFAGSSNVGKSSLINTLLERRKLVKVSRTPGRTQLINFFQCDLHDGRSLGMVDLPGYGFAKVPLEVKAQWGKMMEAYFANRQHLRALVIVMDIRRGMREDDRQLLESLAWFGIQPILVFTKADKLTRNQQTSRLSKLSKELGTPRKELILFSSHNGMGREKLWARISMLCLQALPSPEDEAMFDLPVEGEQGEEAPEQVQEQTEEKG